jgi:HK97 family phage portal protein
MGWFTKAAPPAPVVVNGNGGVTSAIHTTVSLDRMSSQMLTEYVRSIYLWRCVDMIAQMSSSVALEVHNAGNEDGGLAPREQGVANVLSRPNPQWTGANLQYFVAASLAVVNRAYLKQVRGVSGNSPVVLELWPINANEVQIEYLDNSKVISAFKRTTTKGVETYPVDPETGECELIHIHRPALNVHSDKSPAAIAAAPAEVFTRILQRCADIVSNSSNITGLLSTEKELHQKVLDEVRAQLDRFKLNGKESGGTMIAANAKWGLTRLSEDPSTALSVEIKDSLARDVCMTFGVPTQLVGIPGTDTYNNLINARVGFLTDTVLPGYINLYVAALNHALLHESGAQIRVDVTHIPAMAQARLQLVDIARNATMLTVNEQRALLGYPAHDDALANVPIQIEIMSRQRLQVEIMAGNVGKELEGEAT